MLLYWIIKEADSAIVAKKEKNTEAFIDIIDIKIHIFFANK